MDNEKLSPPVVELKPFPKIWTVGSPEIERLFEGPVEITEKLDGSQFAWGMLDDGEFFMRSKGATVFPETADKLFKPAISRVVLESQSDSVATKIKGHAFYGETLAQPRHNTIAYTDVPRGNIALFGVKLPNGTFLNDWESLKMWSDLWNIDVVPLLANAIVENAEQIKDLLNTDSYLGGTKIEGVVIKNYNEYSKNFYSPQCFGKYVREDFKEKNSTNWKSGTNKGQLERFTGQFKTVARWNKAIQHLRDKNELENSPRDIGKLILEVHNDILEEETAYIKDSLFNLYKNQILRKATSEFPEFYKSLLLEEQFIKNK